MKFTKFLIGIGLLYLWLTVSATTAYATEIPPTTPTASEWDIECVDCSKRFTEAITPHSLGMDGAGHLHFVYGGDHLYYARYDGTNWHYETIDNAPNVGAYATLALDAAGSPHIAYYDDYHQSLKYAHWDGAAWAIQTVDSSATGPAALAVDSLAHPHFSYTSQGMLKYAYWTGNEWDIQSISGQAHSPNLALDSFDRPHMVYFTKMPDSSPRYTLKYTYWTGDAWLTQDVSADGGYAPPSLALDTAGRPHISYCGNSYYATTVMYTHLTEQTWEVETVEGNAYTPFCSRLSLALDAAGHPHLGYYYNYSLKYADRISDAWHIQTVESNPELIAGFSPSLVLDADGTPHLGYMYIEGYSPIRKLKYAHWTGAAWEIYQVDEGGDSVGQNTSVALDSLGHPHISYQNAINLDLKYAQWNGTTWEVQTVATEGDAGYSSALVLDTAGQPHIAYFSRKSTYVSYLMYAHWTGAAWDIQIVDTVEYIVEKRGISLALDAANRPHISYVTTYSGSSIKYACWTGTTWDIQTVDSTGIYSQISMALDTHDYPHISYTGGWYAPHTEHSELLYAHWTGSEWEKQTVRAETCSSYVGPCPYPYYGPYSSVSLALDAADRPYILNADNAGLRLHHWTGAAWDWQTITSDRRDGALALDALGWPHVAYYDGGLKYAWNDSVAWHIASVDTAGDVGKYAALALDEAGLPRISYYDQSDGDLKYARMRYPHLALNEQVVPQVLTANAPVTYTLTLFGPGLTVQLRDPLPTAFEYIPGSLTGTLTPPATYSPTLNTILWEGCLPTATLQTLQFQLIPKTLITAALAPRTNTAWLTDTQYGRVISATTVVDLPPLSLHQAVTPDAAAYGDTLTYTLTLFGPGLPVRLADPLPLRLHFIPDSFSGTLTPTAVYSSTAHAVYWTGALPLTTPVTLTFQATLVTTDTTGDTDVFPPIVNTAWLTDTRYERFITATTAVTITPPPLSLRKEATPVTAGYSDTLTYTLTLFGPGLPTRLADPLPRQMRFVADSFSGPLASTATYSPTVHTVYWAGTLPLTTPYILTFQATLAPTGTGTFVALPPIVNTAWLTDTLYHRNVRATAITNAHYHYLPLVADSYYIERTH